MRWLALMRRCAEFKVRHIEDIRKDFNYSSVNVCSDKDTDYAITGS